MWTATAAIGGSANAARSAQLSAPIGVAVDRRGNVYVADTFNHRILRVDATGVITTVAGTGIVGSTGDGGAATIGRDVGAQGGDFGRLAIGDGSDRAVGNSGRDRLDAGGFEPGDDVVGAQPGSEVDVVDRDPQQFIAHRTADIAGQPLVGTERIEDPRHPAPPPPAGRVELHIFELSRVSSRRRKLTSIAAVAPQIRRPFQLIW